MNDIQFGQRQHDTEDIVAIIAILQNNNKVLSQIAKTSHRSHSKIVTLAIQHFASLSLEEQWELVKKHMN